MVKAFVFTRKKKKEKRRKMLIIPNFKFLNFIHIISCLTYFPCLPAGRLSRASCYLYHTSSFYFSTNYLYKLPQGMLVFNQDRLMVLRVKTAKIALHKKNNNITI